MRVSRAGVPDVGKLLLALMRRGLKRDFKPLRQGGQPLVPRPEDRAGRNQCRGQQGQIHPASAESIELFALDEVHRFGHACRGGSLQQRDVGERLEARRGRRTAGQFAYDQGMGERLIHHDQLNPSIIAATEVVHPDRGVDESAH